jgi:hypothetical protein
MFFSLIGLGAAGRAGGKLHLLRAGGSELASLVSRMEIREPASGSLILRLRPIKNENVRLL